MKRFALISLFALTVGAVYAFPPAQTQKPATPPAILTWHNDNGRTGQNLQETTLTTTNVNATTFGKVFSYPVDGNIYAQPLYVPNVTINGVAHNVIYVVTENDSIYAFDADSATLNPNPLWQVSLISPPNVIPYPCLDYHAACTIYPIVGITGTPVINLANNTMYFVARTKEIVSGNSNPFYFERLHAIDIRTGAEQPNSPATICGDYYHTGMGCVMSSGTFNPIQDGQRPGLLLTKASSGFPQGILWIGFAGKGMVLAYAAGSLVKVGDWTATPHPKNTTGGGGIWGSGGGLTGDANGNVYVSVGDGTFDVNVGGNNYGDSVVKLNLVSNGGKGYTIQVMDYFTPPDEACRQTTDADLGSGGAMLLPTQPGAVPNILMIGGKGNVPTCDAVNPFYLINADNMGGLGGGIQSVGAAWGYWSNPVYFSPGLVNNLYFGGTSSDTTGDYFRQYRISNGLISPSASISKTTQQYLAGPTPSISANGTKQGIVWVSERPNIIDDEKGAVPAVLHAYPAANLHTELYNSNMNAARDQAGPAVKFGVPTVVNGKVYIGTQTELDVYGLCPCPQ